MIIPKIEKKIEKFISSESGLISKKKLISAGVAISAASLLMNSAQVNAGHHESMSASYTQADIPRASVVTGSETLCTISPASMHMSCDSHGSWGSHGNCDSETKTIDVVKKCYTHSDNFVPSVGSDGKSIVSTHSHSYMPPVQGTSSLTKSADPNAGDSWL